jgi:pyrrolidone-carboxylate peptidase
MRTTIMKLCLKTSLILSTLMLHPFNIVTSAQANEVDKSLLNVEELRIEKAKHQMPQVFKPLANRVEQFNKQINQARNLTALTQITIRHSEKLWQEAVKSFDEVGRFDDRSLYWARLQLRQALQLSTAFQQLLPMQQQGLLWQLELLSRGKNDVKFDKGTDKKILITGFDPFFLDRNIDQSNPSGVAALALDDLVISRDGKSAEIETLVVPVRFADFDQGMIETLLAPYFRNVDMIITISMGRENFDLERFPGLRRSAKAPDNLNVFTGADAENPLIPIFKGNTLPLDEFVEFSLPVTAMQKAKGKFNINDNNQVTTLRQTFKPSSLNELKQSVSVQGSGGGYLSNEISYRSIVLRNKLNPVLPVGHIHTPRIKAYQPKTSADIVKQIKQMLNHAINAI